MDTALSEWFLSGFIVCVALPGTYWVGSETSQQSCFGTCVVCMRSQSLQSCLNLCDPMACSLPGSSVRGILQTRILEWVAILFSREFSNPGIKSGSPALQADSLLRHQGSPLTIIVILKICTDPITLPFLDLSLF